MTNPSEILPGMIFYSYLVTEMKEKVCFWDNHTLILQVSGKLSLEMASHQISMTAGEMMLIGKNQLGTIVKIPLAGENYETIVISLQEDLLRRIALEEKFEATGKYIGPPNIMIPSNEYLRGFFQSIIPYSRSMGEILTQEMGILKIKEGVKLLLHTIPGLRNFLFDFSEPFKIDINKFMLANFRSNVPIQRFAKLTGRSLAAFKRDFIKSFGMSPRQWLLDKRLTEAKYLIETKHQKPTAIYLDLGFETLSHFSYSFKKKFGKSPTDLLNYSLLRKD